MRRYNGFLLVSGVIGLAANLLAIVGYFDVDGALSGWRPDPGLLVAGSFLTLAYLLGMWSIRTWRRVRRSSPQPANTRSAHFLLISLAALPGLTLWLYLLTSALLAWPLNTVERWMIALGLAWFFTPFAALGLMVLGEILGPLLTPEPPQSSASRPEG